MKKIFIAVVGLILCLTSSVKATVLYWDPEGTTTATAANLTGTWTTTTAQWSSVSAQTNNLIAFVSTDAACFVAGSTAVSTGFTVTVTNTISCAGIFQGSLTPPGYKLTLAGPGALSLNAGADAISTGGSDSYATIINLDLTGPGAAVIESGYSAQLTLAGTNTYTGGTYFGYSSSPSAFGSIVNFTNTSFGTGPIYFSDTSGAMVALGAAALNITNAVTNIQPTSIALTFNIVGNAAGVTYSGPWNLGATTNAQLNLSAGGTNYNLVVLSGKVSGANGLNKYGVGILELTGANTYGAATALGGTYISNGVFLAANTTGSATGISSVTITNSTSPVGTGVLSGSGFISGSVTNYGAISATNTAGGCATLTTGSETWQPGSEYSWMINNVNGTAGAASGWDNLLVNGTLNLPGTFTINLVSLTAANKVGPLAGFTNTGGYSFPILTATNGITGFNSANVTIATSQFSNSLGSGSFTVSVISNTMYVNFGQPPTVTVVPASFSVSSGKTAIISAIATGTQLTYQWQLNGGPLNSADIVGSQTNSTLTISPVSDADAGTYTVTVTDPVGSVSANSILTVVDLPQYSASAGTFTLNFSGPVGQNYRIWSTSDLTLEPVESTWTFVSSGQFNAGVNSFTDTSATGPELFYSITVP